MKKILSVIKNFLMSMYALIMLILFCLYNFAIPNIRIGGILYQVFMIGLIMVNLIIFIRSHSRIKCKSVVIIVYALTWAFSKNVLQCFFAISSMAALMVLGFKESKWVKGTTIAVGIILSIFSVPLLFLCLMKFDYGLSGEPGRDDIYSDLHYYDEENHKEAYGFSAGAMDRMHYSIGKYYEFRIGRILYIIYDERNEVSQDMYEMYLKTHNCKLVGERNGFN